VESKSKLGTALLRLGRLDQTAAVYAAAIELHERLLREFGARLEWQWRGVGLTARLGDACLRLRQTDEAIRLLSQAERTTEHLMQEFGVAPEALTLLGWIKMRGADVRLEQGQTRDALALAEDTLRLRERIVREYGVAVERLREIADSKLRVSGILQMLDRPAEAVAAAREGLVIRERIVREFGRTAERLNEWVAAGNEVSRALLATGDSDAAEALCEHMTGLSTKFDEEVGANRERDQDVMDLHTRRAGILLRRNEVDRAMELFSASLALGDTALSAPGPTFETLARLVTNRVGVVGCLRRTGQWSDVISHSRAALRTTAELAERFPAFAIATQQRFFEDAIRQSLAALGLLDPQG
jgi:tetratricopeptide (TPR) repeat protein